MDIADSMVFEKANPENAVPLSAVAKTVDPGGWGGEHRRGLFDWGWSRNIDPVLDPDVWEKEHGWPCLLRQLMFCEVEVDAETGEIDIVDGTAAYDMGKAFDPDALDQQIFGGFAMGVSRTGFEEQIYDPQTGVQLTDNLIGYPIVLMNDAVLAEPHIVETGGGYGPYGAAGCGEGPASIGQSLIPIAVHNAIGVWVDAPPTPMRILKALGKA
jgi:xanthine dehydrogenase molybdenum-binding subunit